MKRWLCWILPVTLAGHLHAQTPVAAPPALDSLLKNSPFGSRPTETAPPDAGGPLELRGVFVDQGETFFSLYESSSRISRWVGLNESGNPFTVRSYDQAKAEAKVLYQGREIPLGLKQAKVVALAPPPPLLPAASAAVPAPAVAVVAGGGTPNDEAARLAAIAQEIGRRRALRQQALQPKPATPPTPVK